MADVRDAGAETIAAFGLKSRRKVASWSLMCLSILAVLACILWGVDERRAHPAAYDLAAAAQARHAQIQTAAVAPPP